MDIWRIKRETRYGFQVLKERRIIHGTKDGLERQSLEPRLGWRDKAWNQGKDVETKFGFKVRMERQSSKLKLE